jgi:hypothetical protein
MARSVCSFFHLLQKVAVKKPTAIPFITDHSSTLKTLQEIFGLTPLLGAAADSATNNLSDLFPSDSPIRTTRLACTFRQSD